MEYDALEGKTGACMAQDPHSTPNDDLTAPPSFIPAASHKRAVPSSDASTPPPSFTPSGAASGKPTMTPAHQQTPVGGKQPSLPREPRRAGGARGASQSPASSQAPSLAPAASRASSFKSREHGTPRVGSGSSSKMPPPSAPSASSAQRFAPSSGPEAKTSTKRRSPARIIVTLLVSIIAIIALLLTLIYAWVNGQLQHFDTLSTRADDSAQTWLITGSDVRDGTAGTGDVGSTEGDRTDSIMMLVKPKSGRSALISIPRDSYVKIDGKDLKINAAAETYGWQKFTEKVEEISGLKIDHSVRIGFGGVTNVVDALDGIELCYDRTFDDAMSGLKWEAGCHTVDGATALAFSRMRYSDPEGDFGRTKRQRMVIQAIAKKAANKDTLLSISKDKAVASAALAAIKVDEKSNAFSLLKMALAFKDATGTQGISGTLYYSNPGYYPPSGIGSSVLLAADKNLALFSSISDGSQTQSTVGGYVSE